MEVYALSSGAGAALASNIVINPNNRNKFSFERQRIGIDSGEYIVYTKCKIYNYRGEKKGEILSNRELDVKVAQTNTESSDKSAKEALELLLLGSSYLIGHLEPITMDSGGVESLLMITTSTTAEVISAFESVGTDMVSGCTCHPLEDAGSIFHIELLRILSYKNLMHLFTLTFGFKNVSLHFPPR